jgi:hypothetical protein
VDGSDDRGPGGFAELDADRDGHLRDGELNANSTIKGRVRDAHPALSLYAFALAATAVGWRTADCVGHARHAGAHQYCNCAAGPAV